MYDMKLTKFFITVFLAGGIALFSSCGFGESDNTDNTDSTDSTDNIFRNGAFRPVFSNEILFFYDGDSQPTMDSFYEMSTMSDLNLTYPMTAVRENDGEYYTVYSLKDRKLAYVIFQYSPYTGVTFYLKDIVEYPYTTPEQELPFLLEQDLPEKILARRQ